MAVTGLILGFGPSQRETALFCNDVSHWLDASLESALHHFNQGRYIVTWMLKSKLQWNLKQNIIDFIQEITLQNVFCKMPAILFRLKLIRGWIMGQHYSCWSPVFVDHLWLCPVAKSNTSVLSCSEQASMIFVSYPADKIRYILFKVALATNRQH